MATLEEVNAYSDKYGDPLSQGVNIIDQSGNKVGNIPYGEMSGQAFQNNNTIYKDYETGQWTNFPKVKIDLDKNTGKITVETPDELSKRDVFKENLLPMIETLSADYKDNPNTKYMDREDESKEPVGIEEKIAEFQKELNETYLPAARELERGIQADKEKYGIEMSDSQYLSRRTQAVRTIDENGNIIDPSGTALQSIPTSIFDKADLLQLKSLDWDKGTATREEIIDKIWSRIDSNEEKLSELYGKAKVLAYNQSADPDERARAIAFLEFMQDTKPEMTFWDQVSDNIDAAFKGIVVEAGGNLGLTIASFVEAVGDLGVDFMSAITHIKPAGPYETNERGEEVRVPVGVSVTRLLTGDNTRNEKFFADFMDNAYQNWIDEYHERQQLFKAPEAATFEAVGNIMFTVLEAVGSNQLADMALTKAAGAVSKVAKSASTAESLVSSGLAIESVGQINKGAKIMVNLLGFEKAASLLSSITKVADLAMTLGQSKIFATPIKLVAESLAEAFATRPDLVRDLMSSRASDGAVKDAVLEELAYNVGGWAVGLGLGKSISAFSKSAVGQAMSFNAARRMAKIAAGTGDISTNIRVKLTAGANNVEDVIKKMKQQKTLFGKSKMGKVKAYEERLLSRALRKSMYDVEKVKWLGKDSDEIMASLGEARQKSISNIEKFSNALDDYFSGNRITIEQFKSAAEKVNISKEYAEFSDSFGKLIDAEEVAAKNGNDMFRPIAKRVGDTAESAGILSQTTTNYIGATKTLEFWTNWANDTRNVVDDAVRETMAEARFQIETFVNNATPELKAAADSVIAKNRLLWNKLEEVYKHYGVENTAAIMGKKASGYMGIDGGDYYLVQRKSQLRDHRLVRADGTVPVTGEVKEWQYAMVKGAKGDYVDPMIVLQDSMADHARLKNRNDLASAFNLGTGNMNAVVIGVDDTEYVRNMNSSWGKGKSLQKAFDEASVKSVKSLGEDLSSSKIVEDMFDYKAFKSIILKEESKAAKLGAQAAKAKIGDVSVTIANRVDAIKGLNADELGDTMMKNFGYRSSSEFLATEKQVITSQDVKLFENYIKEEIPSQARTFLREKMWQYNEIYGVANNPLTLVYGEELGGLPKINYDEFKRQWKSGATWKDIPGWLRQHLSKDGMMPDMIYQEAMYEMPDVVTTTNGNHFDELLSWYEAAHDATTNVGRIFDYDSMRRLIAADPSIPQEVDRIILSNTPSARDSEAIAELARQAKRDDIYAKANFEWKEALDRVTQLQESIGLDEIKEMIVKNVDDLVTEQVAKITKTPEMAKVFDSVADKFGLERNGQVDRYFALKALKDNADEFKKALNKSFDKQFKILQMSDEFNVKNVKKTMSRLYNEYTNLVEDGVNSAFDNARLAIQNYYPELIDVKDYFKEMRNIMNDIKEVKGRNDIIMTTNKLGQVEWIEVNPILADFLNTNSIYETPSTLAKVNYITNRLFRMGTTGPLSFKSLTNQMFRDSLNAYTGGMTMTLGQVMDNMTKEFGDDIVDYYKKFQSSVYDDIAKQAQEVGGDVREMLVRRELESGQAYLSSMERTAQERLNRQYRYTKYVNGETKEGILDKMINKMDDWFENSNNPINPDKINQWREGTLRNTVYQNGYYDALKKGMSIEDARVHAQYLASNATTNFTRKTVLLNSIQSTTPYLGAAINGTRSFWRLASMDPLGVFSRMFMGIGVPTIALTIASLSNERDKAVYKNLKEYQKEDCIPFVINGQALSIPIPQEVSPLVAPFRQLVETMYDSNRHDFWDLATNDIVGILPVDFKGFTDIDAANLTSDQEWYNRISFDRGISKLAAQLMPPLLKSSVIGITGIDPYTGNKVDKSRKVYDPETGEILTMDDYSGQFAQCFAGLFGNSVSASMAEAIMEGIIGNGGVDFLNNVVNYARLATGNEKANEMFSTAATPGFIAENILTRMVADPLSIGVYGQAQSAWKKTVAALYDEKEALVNSDAYQSVVKNINNATTEESKQKAIAAMQNLINPFYQKTRKAVENLNSVYGAQFDSTKFASVISLLNMADATPLPYANTFTSALSDEVKKQGKAQAIATMQRIGFTSPSDSSLFGSILRNSTTGETYYNYTTPLAILNTRNQIWNAGDIYKANLEARLDQFDDRLDNIYDQINAIYGDKKKLSNSDYNKIDAIKMNWNAEVMTAIEPYIEKYGANKVLTNDTIYGVLAKYILVPGEYEKGNNGRAISASRLNKQYGFAKSYIQSIFKED